MLSRLLCGLDQQLTTVPTVMVIPVFTVLFLSMELNICIFYSPQPKQCQFLFGTFPKRTINVVFVLANSEPTLTKATFCSYNQISEEYGIYCTVWTSIAK